MRPETGMVSGGVGSRRAGSGGNGGNARRCPHRPLPDSPPGWLVRLSAPETPCGESPAGSWCNSLPPRPPLRQGSGSEGFPFLLSVGWACERPRPRPRPACCWVPQPEKSSRRLGAGRGLGRGHQLLPALPPSLLPILKAAAWELAPSQGPLWSPALLPPATTLLFLHWEPPPPLSGGREGIGGWGWVVRDYILPFTNLNRSAGRGFLAFALLQRRLWGFEFPSPWKKSGCFTCRLEQLLYPPSTVSGSGQSPEELLVVSDCDSFFSLSFPGTILLIPSFLWCWTGSAQIRVWKTANDSINLEDYVI